MLAGYKVQAVNFSAYPPKLRAYGIYVKQDVKYRLLILFCLKNEGGKNEF